MRLVTAARPAIRVKDSRLWSQNSLLPPKPRSLIIDRAKSSPHCSAFCTTCLFSSNVGLYCGELVEISQPLFPIGMKMPISIGVVLRHLLELRRPALHQRLDALAELLHADQEVVEGEHDALGGGYRGAFVEQAGHRGIGADQGPHVEVDGAFGGGDPLGGAVVGG